MLVHRGAVVEAQHVAYFLVEFLSGVLAGEDALLVGTCQVVELVSIVHALGQSVGVGAKFHVEAVLNHVVGGSADTPVGNGNAVELPVPLQDILNQHLVGAAGLVVVPVVSTHHCPDLALLDSSLEGRQVNLVESTVAHDDIAALAEGFLIIQGEVLGTGGYTCALNALDVRNYHTRSEVRILA